MPPLCYEKEILRRISPTWAQTVYACMQRSSVSFTEAELATIPKANERYGLSDALLILSPGVDINRLLFYGLVYALNPLEVFCDSYTTQEPEDVVKIDEEGLVLKAGIFAHVFNFGFDAKIATFCPKIDSKFHNRLDVQCAIEMSRRLILILGLEPEQCVVTATSFAATLKKITRPSNKIYAKSRIIRLPFIEFIDHSYLSTERQKLMVKGGVYSIPARILLVDLLTGKVLPELISGIFIYQAHSITKDANIGFCIKLIKSRNRFCWLKAISDSPLSCSPVSPILSQLYTRDFFLYPRCSQTFKSALDNPKIQPRVQKIGLGVCRHTFEIHKAIISLIQRLLNELHRVPKFQDVDMNRIMYSKNVRRVLQQPLDSCMQSRSLHLVRVVNSIINLKNLIIQLCNMDSVSFLAFLSEMRDVEANSHWPWTPEGQALFNHANQRVYKMTNGNPKIVARIQVDPKLVKIGQIIDSQTSAFEIAQTLKSKCKRLQPKKKPDHSKSGKVNFNTSSIRNLKATCKMSMSLVYLHRVRLQTRQIETLSRLVHNGYKFNRRVCILADGSWLSNYLYTALAMGQESYLHARLFKYASTRAHVFANTPTQKSPTSLTRSFYQQRLISENNETDKLLTEWVMHADNMGTLGHHNVLDGSWTMDTFATAMAERDGYNSDSSTDMAHEPGTSGMDVHADSRVLLRCNKNCRSKVYVINTNYFSQRTDPLRDVLRQKIEGKMGFNDQCCLQELVHVLNCVNPSVIIIYKPNVALSRLLEHWHALKASNDYEFGFKGLHSNVRVYSLEYTGLLEENWFKRDIVKELDIWKSLLQEKRTLHVSFDEGVLLNPFYPNQSACPETSTAPSLAAISDKLNDGNNNLKALGSITRDISNVIRPQVIVDQREFRSRVPKSLFDLGVDLIPHTLEFGDYILTPDIAIERKTLQDLIQSLSSGRICQQLTDLTRNYSLPMLLIEFSSANEFYLGACNEEHPLGFNYIYSRLCALCCNFPKVTLVWAESPNAAANMFMAIKNNRSEPHAVDVAINGNSKPCTDLLVYKENGNQVPNASRRWQFVKNKSALKALRRIPGISSMHVDSVLSRVDSILHLSQCSLQELLKMLPEPNAQAVYSFFHDEIVSV